MEKSPKYASWHSWQFKKVNHNHVHLGALVLYVLFVGLIIFNNIGYVFAADLSDNWNFSTPADYQADSGVDISGNNAHLKPQEYSPDSNTSALYHLNENSGSSVDDSSTNNNDGATINSPSWNAGNMNNSLSLNGTSQYASAPDSPSLSVTGQQSLEAWIKPSSTFNNQSGQSQTIIDKGSYKLGLDRTNGKAFYEIENTSSEQWTKRLGGDQAGSWSFNHLYVNTAVSFGSKIYVGLGTHVGDAEVWEWNGSTWSMVGGDGIRGSWADQIYENVTNLAVLGDNLYAGLGDSGSLDGEIWTCNVQSGCGSWSKIAGDGVGGITSYGSIGSLKVHNSVLYAGMVGSAAGYGDLWRYDGGTSWTQIGGDGINGSWALSTYERVESLSSDGTNLYAGLGVSTNDAEVWRWNGSSWLKIGGDGANGSWNTNYETVTSLDVIGTTLYVGLGNGANDAEVWRWNGSSWLKIGGDGANNSWNSANHTIISKMANDGVNLYVGTGNGVSAGEVWRWDGTTWIQIGGDGLNNSWTTAISNVFYLNSTLYATGMASSNYYLSTFWQFNGSNDWDSVGGSYLNNGWGGAGISNVVSSTVHSGKVYFGLGSSTNGAQVYEYDGTISRRIGGSGLDSSWPVNTYEEVSSLISYKGQLYVGLGTEYGDAEVWRWNGSSWQQLGGKGMNSTWNTGESVVSSMAVYKDNLYVGLGAGSYNADIWQYDGTSWLQVAGEPGSSLGAGVEINGSWKSSPRGIDSLVVYKDQLCAGLGGIGGYAEVWCWSGAGNWQKIGGGYNTSTNGSWALGSGARVNSLAVYEDKLYAGIQSSSHSAQIWEWGGSTWIQIAGTSLNSSWDDGAYTWIKSMTVYNGYLYASVGATGSSNPNGDIFRWDNTNWEQIGGDGINGSWTVSENKEVVPTMAVYQGKLYAGLGFSQGGDALVYSFGNNAYIESSVSSFSDQWQHIAGIYDGVRMKMYVNGVEDASRTISASGVDSSKGLLIGSSFGSSQTGDGQSFFKGQLDEIRISNTARSSLVSKPYVDNEQAVTLANKIRESGIASWDGFTSSENLNGGTIKYRLSDDDGTTWKYWNGSAWVVSSGLPQANLVIDINDHISDFPVTFSGIRWQAVLKGDGTQKVELDDVTLTANSDSDSPSNVSNLRMYKSNGGDEIFSNAWTNASTPYFSWDNSTDGGSGMLGYCLYLGTSNSADPATTKGLLGTSPVNSGGNCQFTVGSNSVDLSTFGYLGSSLTTSGSSYYLILKGIDKAGNLSSSSAQFQFRFDNIAPTNPGYITAPSQFVASKEVTFTWPTSGSDSPSDDDSGISGLQYRIGPSSSWYGDGVNGAGYLANDGNYTTRSDPDFPNINEGINTVYFRTWDQAGNVTTNYTTAALKLNNTSPSGPQNVVATPSINTTNSFAFSWDPPATYSGPANAIAYCYTVNATPTVNNCTFTSAGVTSLPAGAFATQPGDNTFYVVAKDEAGNINYATASSATFTANTSAPGIPLDLDIADVSIKSSSSWRLALTWAEPSNTGAGIASYRIRRSTDNINFTQVATTSGTSHVDSGLNQTKYYYKVSACDSANNCGADSSIVNQTPTGKFTSPANLVTQPNVTGISTKKATIKWATDRASDSKISLGTKSGEYAPFQVASSSQVSDHSVDLNNLSPGTVYYAKAVWTDEDGNTGMSHEFTFATTPAPSTQEVNTQRVTLSSAQVRFTSVSASKVVLQYGKSDTFGGIKEISTSLSKSTYDLEISGLDDDTKYFYRLNTFDEDGNEYPGSTVLTFTTPARPRIENLRFQPIDGEPTSSQKITWTTNVPSSSLVSFSANNSPGKEVTSSELVTEHEITVRDLLDDTEYTLIAESRDRYGNLATSDKQTLKTALDTRPPKIKDATVETSIRGSGAEARGQVVVSWKTDEPATSQVAYAEGSDAKTFNNKTSEDSNMSLEHIVIVSDLPTSRVYSVQPISKDRSSNAGTGDTKSAIIGRASDNVMTIVLNTLRKVFGF